MIYKSVSIKQVIGRIIRNTRLQDSSFIQDMGEWIPEAMGYMRTRVVLSPTWKDIKVDFHKGKLPCDLRTLSAVAYKNSRMRHNNSGIATYGIPRDRTADGTSFISQPTSTVIAEVIGKKVFTADTTAGAIWATDYLLIGTTEFPIPFIIDSTNLAADTAALSIYLNSLNQGTFIVTWDGSLLSIELKDAGTITGIAYHRVTLDAPVLLMVVASNTTIATAYETNSLDTIKSVEQCMALPYCHYTYYTELDYINTSLCDGTIRIFYKAIPIDEDGFPLIPDNEDYKEALYWYVRGKMIGTGYRDTVFKITDCEARYDHHATRAIGQIRYPSVDEVETRQELSTRLILPDNYFETFFANPGKEGMIDM